MEAIKTDQTFVRKEAVLLFGKEEIRKLAEKGRLDGGIIGEAMAMRKARGICPFVTGGSRVAG